VRRPNSGLSRLASPLALLLCLFLALVISAGPAVTISNASNEQQSPGQRPPDAIRAASVDPAAYLPRFPNASVLARTLAERMAQAGVNTIYVNAYNVKYGAYYVTS